MGEVYRARDLKLDREVAVKVLPQAFAADPERLARFEREARTLASLNHASIAHIHGVEDAGDTRAIVMELVAGEDLAARLARGPLPIAEALPIARQIAEALQAAHDLGIVHRDLKPANVKVKPDGAVKLLDFGLAKAGEAPGAGLSLAQSPTYMMSMPGALLGTVPYMSPEQVKGQLASARSDVWAFGCVLYEMLTGRAAFAGETTSDVIASVLTTEPDWRRLPATTPPSIRRLLRRCLQKADADRLRAAADARFEIDDALQPKGDEMAPSAAMARRERLAWGSAVALIGAVALAWAVWGRADPPLPAEVRFDIATPAVAAPMYLSSFAISPDQRSVLYVADADGQPHVWVRAIDESVGRPLAGTGGGYSPFWSPNGRSIAFHADGFVKRLDLEGGLVRTLTKSTVGVGGSWSDESGILFVRNPASAIVRVPADGGPAQDMTRLEPGHVGHAFPHFLPDGRHFLYYVTAAADARGIYVGQIDGPSRRLIDADGGGVYANGHLLFVRQATVLAQAFDVNTLEISGSPFKVADGVFGVAGGQSLTLSASGAAFAFRAGDARFARQFVWIDRTGRDIAKVSEPLANPDGVSSSPDLSQLVFFERGPTSSDLWILDVRRGLVSMFTDDPDEDIFPFWSRDGEQIIYSAVRNGQLAVYQRPLATGNRELLIRPEPVETFVTDMSRDRRYLVYQRMDAKSGWDIWALPFGADAVPLSIVRSDADERTARLSPDGGWIAFVSNNSGLSEVYVQPFPGPGRRLQVSTKGGDQPQWRADAAELFYMALDGKLMATPIAFPAGRQSIEIGAPVPLFSPDVGVVARPIQAGDYIPTADGQRFLVNRLVRDNAGTPLRIVLNWHAERRRE